MLTLRQRLFFSISLVVLGIFAIVLIIIVVTRDPAPEEPPPVEVDTTDPTVEIPPPVFDDSLNLPPVLGSGDALSSGLANEDETARYVRQLAITFVERFLSYSNQSRNSHITDVLPLVSAQMKTWVATQGQAYDATYHGSTTQVIVSRVEAISETTASVHIEAQQTLESTDGKERIYHIGRADLVKQNDTWYIDGLYWD